MHPHTKLRRGLELRPDQIARADREDIVVVEAGRAAVLHQLAHTGQARQADDIFI